MSVDGREVQGQSPGIKQGRVREIRGSQLKETERERLERLEDQEDVSWEPRENVGQELPLELKSDQLFEN